MKFTIESFDFSGLSENSILMIEVDENKTNALQRTNRTIQALFKAKKIPSKALCLINSKQHPINLREIPEKVMNDNGWYKLIIEPDFVKKNQAAMNAWGKKHCRCPKCASRNKTTTLMGGQFFEDGHYEDNLNRVTCDDCGWVGKANELKPELYEKKASQKIADVEKNPS